MKAPHARFRKAPVGIGAGDPAFKGKLIALLSTLVLAFGCARVESTPSAPDPQKLLSPPPPAPAPRHALDALVERPPGEPSADTTVPAAPSNEPGEADLNPGNDFIVAPPDVIPDCDARLEAAGTRVLPATLPTRRSKQGHECGAPQAVVYRGPAGGVRWSSAPIVTCGMALALARFESVLQEEAQKELGQRVVRIEHLGTYACRNMARFDWVSEHSYANAIDLRSFRLANGRDVSVERYFGRPDTEPKTAEGRFLRALARRLYDDGIFSVVVTEFFDKLHHDHIHVDLARYRVDGTR